MSDLLDSLLKKDPNERIIINDILKNDELKKAIHRMSEKGLTLPLECTLKDEDPIELEAHEDFEQADLEE